MCFPVHMANLTLVQACLGLIIDTYRPLEALTGLNYA